jgi:polar amino acid transport system substrate-binding protein
MNIKKNVLLIVFFFFFCSTSYSQEPLTFVRIINTPDQMVGAEILKLGYKRLGIPVKIVEMPGKRALVESSEGRIDGEVHRIFRIGEDYPMLIRIPTPINYIEPTVFSKRVKFTVSGCADLKEHRIGIVRGVRHAENCTEGMKNVHIVNNSRLLMQILHRDRVDIVITARINGLLQIKKLNLDSIYALSPPLSREPVYHYLHKKHEALVPKINRIFKEMEENGTLERLREQFTEELLEQSIIGAPAKKDAR